MNPIVPSLVLLAATANPLAAQFVGPGLTWSVAGGLGAGTFLPSCSNLPFTAAAGDTVTVRVFGDPGSPFLLGTAATATQCLPIPGIGNALVLDLPAFPAWSGLLTQLTPCLACPPGFEELTFVLPALAPGTSAAFQAAGFGNNLFALTVAVTVTVQ